VGSDAGDRLRQADSRGRRHRCPGQAMADIHGRTRQDAGRRPAPYWMAGGSRWSCFSRSFRPWVGLFQASVRNREPRHGRDPRDRPDEARPIIQAAWAADVREHGAGGPAPLEGTPAALDPALWFFGKWAARSARSGAAVAPSRRYARAAVGSRRRSARRPTSRAGSTAVRRHSLGTDWR
jgi:hypothetical protein